MLNKRFLLIGLAVIMAMCMLAYPVMAAEGLLKSASNPVIVPEFEWEGYDSGSGLDGQIGACCVITEEGKYKMWYSGKDTDGYFGIGYAKSDDGIVWQKIGTDNLTTISSAEAWDDMGVGSPSVVHVGLYYHMWFTGVSAALVPSIGYARSSDGISWNNVTKVSFLNSNGWDTFGTSLPSVIYDADASTYKMWFTGHAVDIFPTAIGYADGTDPTIFTESSSNPVLTSTTGFDSEAVCAACVKETSSGDYIMYYTGYDDPNDIMPSIGKATSHDGFMWNKEEDPVLTGESGWESNGVGAPTFLIVNGNIEMWYTGADSENVLRIGQAEESLIALPASSNTSTAIMITGMVIMIGMVSLWNFRRNKAAR